MKAIAQVKLLLYGCAHCVPQHEKGVMSGAAKKNAARLAELMLISKKPDTELKPHGEWTRAKIESLITVEVRIADDVSTCIRDGW